MRNFPRVWILEISRKSFRISLSVSGSRLKAVFGYPWVVRVRDQRLPQSTPAGFCVCLSNPDPESKICEKPDPDPESLFNFGSSRSLRCHFLSKNMSKLPVGSMVSGIWTGVGFSIWKISAPKSRFKNFGTGAVSESEKVTPATSVRDVVFSVATSDAAFFWEISHVLATNLMLTVCCFCLPHFLSC